MTCKITEDKLISFLLYELSQEEQSNLETHIAFCSTCQTTLDDLKDWKAAWDQPSTLPLSESFTENVMENIPIKKSKSHHFNKIHFASMLHLAIASAATFLLVYTGIFDKFPNIFEQFSSVIIDSTNQLQNASGEGLALLNTVNFNFQQLINSFKF